MKSRGWQLWEWMIYTWLLVTKHNSVFFRHVAFIHSILPLSKFHSVIHCYINSFLHLPVFPLSLFSYIYSFVCQSVIVLFIVLIIHLTVHQYIHSIFIVRPSIYPSIYSSNHPFIHSLIYSFVHSVIHCFIHSFVCLSQFVCTNHLLAGWPVHYYTCWILCPLKSQWMVGDGAPPASQSRTSLSPTTASFSPVG